MPKNRQLAVMFAFSAIRIPRIDCEILSKSRKGTGGVLDGVILFTSVLVDGCWSFDSNMGVSFSGGGCG